MKNFKYVINDPQGIHARPAGLLVKITAPFSSAITIDKAGKVADAKKIISIMSLGAKKGEELVISADGADEAEALAALKAFFQENL